MCNKGLFLPLFGTVIQVLEAYCELTGIATPSTLHSSMGCIVFPKLVYNLPQEELREPLLVTENLLIGNKLTKTIPQIEEI